LILTGYELVLVAPDDECGRRDDAGARRGCLDQLFEGFPPDVGGHLEALADLVLDEVGGHGLPGRARDEAPHVLLADRIGELGDLSEETPDRRHLAKTPRNTENTSPRTRSGSSSANLSTVKTALDDATSTARSIPPTSRNAARSPAKSSTA
jgi:hypothetical protein